MRGIFKSGGGRIKTDEAIGIISAHSSAPGGGDHQWAGDCRADRKSTSSAGDSNGWRDCHSNPNIDL